ISTPETRRRKARMRAEAARISHSESGARGRSRARYGSGLLGSGREVARTGSLSREPAGWIRKARQRRISRKGILGGRRKASEARLRGGESSRARNIERRAGRLSARTAGMAAGRGRTGPEGSARIWLSRGPLRFIGGGGAEGLGLARSAGLAGGRRTGGLGPGGPAGALESGVFGVELVDYGFADGLQGGEHPHPGGRHGLVVGMIVLIDQGVQLVERIDIGQIALVVLQDQRDALDGRPVFAQVFLEIGEALQIFLQLVHLR